MLFVGFAGDDELRQIGVSSRAADRSTRSRIRWASFLSGCRCLDASHERRRRVLFEKLGCLPVQLIRRIRGEGRNHRGRAPTSRAGGRVVAPRDLRFHRRGGSRRRQVSTPLRSRFPRKVSVGIEEIGDHQIEGGEIVHETGIEIPSRIEEIREAGVLDRSAPRRQCRLRARGLSPRGSRGSRGGRRGGLP